jgi:hypothetical protein
MFFQVLVSTMQRPNLSFHSWKELPASIIALHFTDPNQPVTQIDNFIDFKDPADRKRLIQFLSIFGWTLHDQFMTSIPCYHLDRSVGKPLTLNVSAANGKVIEYQPAEQGEPSLAVIWKEIQFLKNYIVPSSTSSNQSPAAREARKSLTSKMMSITGLKTPSDPNPAPAKHHQPWTRSEDDQLKQEFESGQDIKDIAATHNRSRLAIQSRLFKLQLVATV